MLFQEECRSVEVGLDHLLQRLITPLEKLFLSHHGDQSQALSCKLMSHLLSLQSYRTQ